MITKARLTPEYVLATLRRSPTAYIRVWRPWGERNFRYALVRGTARQSEDVLDHRTVRIIRGKLYESAHYSGSNAPEQFTLRAEQFTLRGRK